jgi:hypothetical protein
MRRGDDRRLNSLGAPPGHAHAHARLRHLMSVRRPRHARCPPRRGRPRVGDRVSVVVSRDRDHAASCLAWSTLSTRRRRSRGAGPSMCRRARPGIPLPAP